MRTRIAAVVALAALLAAAPAALAHQGNPNYLSQVDAITPATKGVTVDVLNRDDRLLLHNTSGQDVVIRGYNGEPYARVLADGTVQVNRRSPARYLNDDRFAQVSVPAGIDGKGAPRWEEIVAHGRFEWHDHRFHWMAQTVPPAVRDQDVRTKVFDWRIPIEVGGRDGAIAGTLFWTPPPAGGPPAGRRRRARGAARAARSSSCSSCAAGGASRPRRGDPGACPRRRCSRWRAPAAASAHAVLEGTAPERGATLDASAARGRAALQRARRDRVRRGARLRRARA